MNRTRIPGSTYGEQAHARVAILRPAMRSTRWGFIALVFAMMSSAFGFDVSLEAGKSVAYERTGEAATCTLQRNSGANTLDVELEVLSSSSASPADYDLEWLTVSGWQALSSSSGIVHFEVGQQSISIRVRPVNDVLVEGREEVVLNIVSRPNDYNPGGFTSRTFIIADDDHQARIKMVRPVADEDVSLRGDPDDPFTRRRAIVQVIFDNFANNGSPAGFEYANRTDFPRNLSVVIGLPQDGQGNPLPNATLGTDYDIKYRICGHNNPATSTALHSQLGFAQNSLSGFSSTTGLNYKLMAGLAGETTVPLKEQESDGVDLSSNIIPGGTKFYFESDPGTPPVIYTSVGDALSAITFTPALNRPVPSGTKLKITAVGGSGTAPDSVIVEATYATSSTVLKLGGGWGKLYEGDVISIEGDDLPYVITGDPTMVLDASGRYSARVNIFAFEGGDGGGIAVEQKGAAKVTTLISPVIVDGTMQILVPEISTRVEFSIEPRGFGDGAEQAEYVDLEMIADNDYIIVSPTETRVTIADRDVVAGVKVGTSAGLPDIQGTLLFTLSKAFEKQVEVSFEVDSRTLDAFGVPTATVAEGLSFEPLPRKVIFPANTTEYALRVVPKSAGIPADLTVSLSGTDNYKTGGSSSSGYNPSATMHISNVIGTVIIQATDGTAVEGSSTDTGLFTVTIDRLPLQTVEVPLKLAVGGTAVAGRFEFFNPTTPTQTYSVNSSGFIDLESTKIDPAPTTTFKIGVRAIDNQSADGAGSVQLTLNNQGTNYVIGTQASAVVTIQDNEPTLSIAVVQNAGRPSTPGTFRFSYPGVPLNRALDQKVTVKYTFSDAVKGTDFEAQTTVDIAANDPSRYADLIINPTAAGTATSLKVTITADPAYNIASPGFAIMTFAAAEENDPARDKPAPGSISTGSGGGCGLGSGLSALMGLLMTLGWIGLRRRAP
jgi:hypothetical protein